MVSFEAIQAKILDISYCQVELKEKIDFAQILVRFTDGTSDIDCIVFEKCISNPASAWKIVGHLGESDEYYKI